jgi:RecA-family ATPase
MNEFKPVDTSQFKTIGHREMLNRAKRPEMVIKDLLQLQSIVLITGAPGASKTFFSLRMAASICLGMPFLGHEVTVPRNVLFIGDDSAEWDYGIQYQKIMNGLGHTDNVENIEFLCHSGFKLQKDAGAQLASLAIRAATNGKPREENVKGVVFLDTLRALHFGNENDSQWMHDVMDVLREARNWSGCSFVLTHHLAKPIADVSRSGADMARGSGEIIAAADMILRLNPKGGIYEVIPDRLRGINVKKWQYELSWDKQAAIFERCEVFSEWEQAILDEWDGSTMKKKDAHMAVMRASNQKGKATDKAIEGRYRRAISDLVDRGIIKIRDKWTLERPVKQLTVVGK